MTTINQPPSGSIRTADDTAEPEPLGIRLVRLWVALTQNVIAETAHGLKEGDAIVDLQGQVERAIVDRVANHEALLAELLAWEASLWHEAETPRDDCLTCQLASSGPQAELPPEVPNESAPTV